MMQAKEAGSVLVEEAAQEKTKKKEGQDEALHPTGRSSLMALPSGVTPERVAAFASWNEITVCMVQSHPPHLCHRAPPRTTAHHHSA